MKSLDSILLKYERYYPDNQTRKVFNDILGFRAFCGYGTEVDHIGVRHIKFLYRRTAFGEKLTSILS